MPIPTTQIINRTFIRDEVYHSLKHWIINGTLAPGEKLKDKELAVQLGVSRTPIREALRKLDDEGLVEAKANRWTRVTNISLADTKHIYPIISSLESLALQIAFPTLLSKEIEQMKEINSRFEDLMKGDDLYAIVNAETEFHQLFIKAAANQELENILENLKIKYKRIELAYFSQAHLFANSFAEHNKIIEALENRDLDAALNALAQNWKVPISATTDSEVNTP